MAKINYANTFLQIEPVQRHYFGLGLKEAESQFTQFMKVETDEDPILYANEYGGHRQFGLKTESAPITMGDFYQSDSKSWRAATYAGGYTLSYETVKDAKIKEIKSASKLLGRAAKLTPEYLIATFLGEAFDSTKPASWDGLELCSTAHLLPDGITTYSNEAASPQALSEVAIQDIITDLRQMKGSDGQLAPEIADKLIIPSALWHVAKKIATSSQELGSANNDPNVVKGMFSTVVFDYLANTVRYFMTTKNPDGLFWHWREKPQFMTDDSINNLDRVAIGFFRARWGCMNPRGIYGVAAV